MGVQVGCDPLEGEWYDVTDGAEVVGDEAGSSVIEASARLVTVLLTLQQCELTLSVHPVTCSTGD